MLFRSYGGKRKISWMEIFAGEKSTMVYGPDVWLPEETLKVLKDYVVSIKGPLTTPVGGGIRSLNVALRQELDLYVCLRPVRYFKGVPSPLREPEKTDMVIFRENSEDIYAGIEWQEGTDGAKKIIDFLIKEMGVKIEFSQWAGLFVPSATPDYITNKLREAAKQAANDERVRAVINGAGSPIQYMDAPEFKVYWDKESAQMGEVVRKIGKVE